MFDAIVSHSDDFDTASAIAEVLLACDAQLSGRTPAAALLFAGTEYDHALLLAAVAERYPGLPLVGCTTDGEMSSSGGFTEDAVTLTLFLSDTITIAAGVGEHAGAQPMAAAADAIAMAREQLDGEPELAVVLPDGLTASAREVLEGFAAVLGDEVPVVGGMSADRVDGSKETYATYQFHGQRVLSDAVPVLLFSGPIAYSLGVESGWLPIGKRMTVTSCNGNVLHTLDGRPAFDYYVHYLGDVMRENLAGIGSYPLAVYEAGLDRYYLRVAKSADPDTGAITFLAEIPEGAEVQITQAIRDEVAGGVDRSVSAARARYPGSRPAVALMFSCTGRKIALGTRTREEQARVRDGLGDLPMTGFYTFGEIGPVADNLRSRYHNTTFITVLLGER